MPELLHPGVYVREISSGVRPIEGVSTSTAAFLGVSDKGPLPGGKLPSGKAARPVMVTSFTDYVRQFGGFRSDSFMTYAVQSFFNNGGRRLYIVRVGHTDPGGDLSKQPLRASAGFAPSPALSPAFAIGANSPGAWAN